MLQPSLLFFISFIFLTSANTSGEFSSKVVTSDLLSSFTLPSNFSSTPIPETQETTVDIQHDQIQHNDSLKLESLKIVPTIINSSLENKIAHSDTKTVSNDTDFTRHHLTEKNNTGSKEEEIENLDQTLTELPDVLKNDTKKEADDMDGPRLDIHSNSSLMLNSKEQEWMSNNLAPIHDSELRELANNQPTFINLPNDSPPKVPVLSPEVALPNNLSQDTTTTKKPLGFSDPSTITEESQPQSSDVSTDANQNLETVIMEEVREDHKTKPNQTESENENAVNIEPSNNELTENLTKSDQTPSPTDLNHISTSNSTLRGDIETTKTVKPTSIQTLETEVTLAKSKPDRRMESERIPTNLSKLSESSINHSKSTPSQNLLVPTSSPDNIKQKLRGNEAPSISPLEKFSIGESRDSQSQTSAPTKVSKVGAFDRVIERGVNAKKVTTKVERSVSHDHRDRDRDLEPVRKQEQPVVSSNQLGNEKTNSPPVRPMFLKQPDGAVGSSVLIGFALAATVVTMTVILIGGILCLSKRSHRKPLNQNSPPESPSEDDGGPKHVRSEVMPLQDFYGSEVVSEDDEGGAEADIEDGEELFKSLKSKGSPGKLKRSSSGTALSSRSKNPTTSSSTQTPRSRSRSKPRRSPQRSKIGLNNNNNRQQRANSDPEDNISPNSQNRTPIGTLPDLVGRKKEFSPPDFLSTYVVPLTEYKAEEYELEIPTTGVRVNSMGTENKNTNKTLKENKSKEKNGFEQQSKSSLDQSNKLGTGNGQEKDWEWVTSGRSSSSNGSSNQNKESLLLSEFSFFDSNNTSPSEGSRNNISIDSSSSSSIPQRYHKANVKTSRTSSSTKSSTEITTHHERRRERRSGGSGGRSGSGMRTRSNNSNHNNLSYMNNNNTSPTTALLDEFYGKENTSDNSTSSKHSRRKKKSRGKKIKNKT